jgi:BlaI family penicillinase repressor
MEVIMSKLPELAKAEWSVMKCCWNKGQCTARDVYEELQGEKGWRYQTVKTMLDRLVQKGYLKMSKIGPICLFDPAVSQSRVTGRALDTFAGTVLDGALAPIFAHLAKGGKMSAEDIASLKKLIEEHEEESDQ